MYPVDPTTTRVAVLAGGTSSERSVSLDSGKQVSDALGRIGFPNELIDTQDVSHTLHRLLEGAFDVAFIVLHGRGGEDGCIQGLCEYIGIPYTGSDVLASAVSMDKACSKILYEHAGIPIAPLVTLRRHARYNIDDIVAAVGEKCIVKPLGTGSSVGVSVVHTPAELPAALDMAFATGEDAMAETFITGPEVTAGVLGNDELIALPLIETVFDAEFYDYEQKYASAGEHHILPARLTPELTAEVQRYAQMAHKALGCHGVSRTEFIIDADRGPIILETNTIPGMTETSLLPDAARAAGYDFETLCTMLIAYALEGRQ